MMRGFLLVLAGCGQLVPATEPALDEEKTIPSLVVPNETMSFAVTFRGIHVMNAQTAVGSTGWIDGHRAVIVKSRGRTEGIVATFGDVRFDIETAIDLDSGSPIKDRIEGRVEVVGSAPEVHVVNNTFDDTSHDLQSAICALRGWHAGPNEHLTVAVREAGGGTFPIEVWPGGTQTIDGRPAVRFDGISENVHFSIWLSDDLARVPLKASSETEFGTVEISLIDYG